MDPATALRLLAALLAALLVLSVGLTYSQHTLASPTIGIVNRWVRWGLFAVALAAGAFWSGSDRPPWLWVATGLLVWPLLETMYSWLAIKALSHSPVPLFPNYTVNREGDAWPNQPRFLALREWLRQEKFRHVQSLKASILEGHVLRMSVFHDVDERIRLQVLFLPQPTGNVSVCCVFTSVAQSGRRLVTDNVYLPFGGFYPENWEVERRPWTRSPDALLHRHLERLAGCPELLEPFADEPVQDVNAQQAQLERLNTELGLLFPRDQHEERGRLTWEGRYRVWKEAWWLNYFGLPDRH